MRMPNRSLATLLLVFAAACASEPRTAGTPVPPAPADGAAGAAAWEHPPVPDSVRLWAGVHAMPSTPMALMFTIGAHDVRDPNEILPDTCIVGLAAYRDSAAGAAPAWRLRDGEALACTGSVDAWSPPRGRHLPVTEVLGDSLPPGPYRFTILAEVRGDTFQAEAGRIFLTPDTLPPTRDRSALRHTVETRVEDVAPRHLVTRVTATNTGSRRVEVQFGDCALRLRAYRTPARTGRPVWRSELRRPPYDRDEDGFGYACLAYLAGAVVAPGETIAPNEFTARIPFPEILGDSLPDGRYWFAADLDLLAERPAGGLDRDSVRLAAGEAELASRIDPLPAERTVAGVRWRAATTRVPGEPGKLRLTVTATNTGAAPATIGASPSVADCAMQLNGYRTAAMRDAWYLYRNSDWTARECPVRIPQARLASGETRAFAGVFTAPAERRHLSLALWTAAPEMRTERIMLSAGETRPE
jgi:hypothetical protein